MISSWLTYTFCLWISFLGVHLIWENPSHAIYLSLTEVEMAEGAFNFKMKVFSDDLRDALKNHQPNTYKPSNLQEFFSLNKDLANQYFGEHFQLSTGGKQQALQVKGAIIEGDAHFINFSCAVPKDFKELTIKADFFMELFPTQINVVKVKNGAQIQYLKFSMPVAPQSLSF